MKVKLVIKKKYKKPLVIVGAIFLLLLTILLVVVLRPDPKTSQPKPFTGTADPASAIKPTTPIEKAQALAQSGDYEKAQQLLGTEVNNSTDLKEKGALLTEQAVEAYNAGKYDKALGYAQAAEKAAPTRSTSRMIAQSAEQLGNKSLAVEYYQKTIERVNPNSPTKDDDIAELQVAIKRVQDKK